MTRYSRRQGAITAALCFLLGFAGVRPVPGQRLPQGPAPVSSASECRFTAAERAMQHVRRLAEGIGPRGAGQAGERRAAQYIIGVLRGLGYSVRVQSRIPIRGRADTTQDLIAISPHHHGPRTLIVGAHYDSMIGRETSPGANDNASGVAVLLEAARLLADAPLGYELQFVFFGAEEVHHDGSRWMAAQGVSAEGMISVDMIGVGDELCLNYAADPNAVGERLRQAAHTIGLNLLEQRHDPHSDHEAFARAGIPAVWIQRLPDAANHTREDTASRVNPDHVQDVIDLLCTCLVQYRPTTQGSPRNVTTS